MDHELLGKVLASILTACIDAGAIASDAQGVVQSPEKLAAIASGFLAIWLTHPASSKVPQIKQGG